MHGEAGSIPTLCQCPEAGEGEERSSWDLPLWTGRLAGTAFTVWPSATTGLCVLASRLGGWSLLSRLLASDFFPLVAVLLVWFEGGEAPGSVAAIFPGGLQWGLEAAGHRDAV